MSSPDSGEAGCMVFLLLVVLVVGVALGTMLEYGHRLKLKKEAVERGVAEWIVDSGGSTTWQWKEEK